MEKKVAIIILTYNQKKMLEETVYSVLNDTNYKNYKIFLVDNGSKDRHDLMIKEKFPKVDVTRNDKNLGYSKGNNIGIKKACQTYNPDYFVLLNDDIEIINKDWLKKMVNLGESDEKIGLVGCQSIYPDGRLQDIGGYLRKWELTKISEFEENSILDVDHFAAVCMLIKKELIKNVGVLDEVFSPFLLEDSDYCLRVKKAGYSIKIPTNVKIIHKKGQTINSLKDKRALLIRFKNDIIFSKKHLKGFNRFFRIFIFLPAVAVLKKTKDVGELKLKNFRIRKDFMINLYYWVLAFIPRSYKKIIENVN